MEGLLHNYLNRMGRQTTDYEREWQDRERKRCLEALLGSVYSAAASTLRKARPRTRCDPQLPLAVPNRFGRKLTAAFANLGVDDAVAVVDAICTSE